jgi:hypothetical protein
MEVKECENALPAISAANKVKCEVRMQRTEMIR